MFVNLRSIIGEKNAACKKDDDLSLRDEKSSAIIECAFAFEKKSTRGGKI